MRGLRSVRLLPAAVLRRRRTRQAPLARPAAMPRSRPVAASAMMTRKKVQSPNRIASKAPYVIGLHVHQHSRQVGATRTRTLCGFAAEDARVLLANSMDEWGAHGVPNNISPGAMRRGGRIARPGSCLLGRHWRGGLVCRPELKTALRKFGSAKKCDDNIFFRSCDPSIAGRDGLARWRRLNARGRHKKTGPEDPVFLIGLDQSGPT